MINKNLKFFLSAISLFSMVFIATSQINAAPVRFNQVTQVVNAKPGKANNGNYTNLVINNDPVNDPKNDPVNDPKNDPKKGDAKTTAPVTSQDRVIRTTSFEIIEEESCNCTDPDTPKKFPYWALLGLGAIPLIFLIPDNDPDPTPSRTPNSSPTPTPTSSMTPTMTPTPTPTMTPTMTPTPTPPTEPVPEPMTILLFGTGLAGIGLAARKRFGKPEDDEENEA